MDISQTLNKCWSHILGIVLVFIGEFRKNAGTYIEAVINQWGIPDDDLHNITAGRLKRNVSTSSSFIWPPHLDYLIQPSLPIDNLLTFVNYLKA